MTPARIPAAPPRRPAPVSPRNGPLSSRLTQPVGEQAQLPRPLLPGAAIGALPQMGVENAVRNVRRQSLAVDPSGDSGTEIRTLHASMVAPRTVADSTGGAGA